MMRITFVSMRIGATICGAISIVAALLGMGATAAIFAAAGLLLAFAGALRGEGQATVLPGLALNAAGLVLSLVR